MKRNFQNKEGGVTSLKGELSYKELVLYSFWPVFRMISRLLCIQVVPIPMAGSPVILQKKRCINCISFFAE